MSMRGYEVYTATQAFWRASLELVIAWVVFVAPFLADIFWLGLEVWSFLSLERKIQLVGLCLFGYTLLQAYRTAMRKLEEGKRAVGQHLSSGRMRIRQQKDVVVHMVWQGSFLGVAAALWYASAILRPDQLLLCVWFAMSIFPATLSVRCYRRHKIADVALSAALVDAGLQAGGDDDGDFDDSSSGEEGGSTAAQRRATAAADPHVREATARHKHACHESKLWLSYWACWPALEVVDWLILQRYAMVAPDISRAALVLLVWLQLWEGSRYLRRGLRSAFRAGYRRATAILPAQLFSLRAALRLRPGLAASTRMFGRAQALATWAAANKGFAVGVLSVVLLFVYRLLSFVGSLLTLLIIWGAAADTARVVSQNIKPIFSQRLAFWVLSQILQLLCTAPVVGGFLALWQPLLLAGFLVTGEPLLQMVLSQLISAGNRSGGTAASVDATLTTSVDSNAIDERAFSEQVRQPNSSVRSGQVADSTSDGSKKSTLNTISHNTGAASHNAGATVSDAKKESVEEQRAGQEGTAI